jgi:hypothetical protein
MQEDVRFYCGSEELLMEECLGEAKCKVYKISDALMWIKLCLRGEHTIDLLIETAITQVEILAPAMKLNVLDKFEDNVFHLDSYVSAYDQVSPSLTPYSQMQ